MLWTGEATKRFYVALLQANVNFQKERINRQKKNQKNENPNIQNSKKKSKKKSSKEISVRDHSDYEKIPKNVPF